MRVFVFGIGTLLAAVSNPLLARAGDLGAAIELKVNTNRLAAASQARVEKLDDETAAMIQEHRNMQRRIRSLRSYNQQLSILVDNQQNEIGSLQQQIEDAVHVGREIKPLMQKMVDSLEAFIELDLPFLKQERTQRIDRLRRLMSDPSVADSEKFRQVLEAYAIENDYGRSIEDYTARLGSEDQERTVQFLRVGRIALLYLTTDGQMAGRWDQESRTWRDVDSSYFNEIRKGLRIARKQVAPDLLRLPIRAPTAVAGAHGPGGPQPATQTSSNDDARLGGHSP